MNYLKKTETTLHFCGVNKKENTWKRNLEFSPVTEAERQRAGPTRSRTLRPRHVFVSDPNAASASLGKVTFNQSVWNHRVREVICTMSPALLPKDSGLDPRGATLCQNPPPLPTSCLSCLLEAPFQLPDWALPDWGTTE